MKLILPDHIFPELEARLPEGSLVATYTREGEIEGDPSDAEVYLHWFQWYLSVEVLDQVLSRAPQVRWLHTPTTGINHLQRSTLVPQRDLTLTHGAGAFAIPIAEYVFTYMLAHTKQVDKLRALQSERTWFRPLQLNELYGKTILILGTGTLGQAIAERAQVFGLRVWGSRRHPQPTPGFDQIFDTQSWRQVLGEVDFLVVATPLTPETKGMITHEIFAALPNHAYLINVARGAIINEADLIEALQTDQIAGATLDTFTTEPLPSDHPLWSRSNVLISPHCSGSSPAVHQRSIDIFLDNLHRYQSGIPLRNRVDWQAGY
ncbi:MAG: D-2-hydroxyacid dehydrogenase [Cyanophyceae cyanobacterium]